jgi:hypothetical protein
MSPRPTAFLAAVAALLREALGSLLARGWPFQVVVAHARNGRAAVEQFDPGTKTWTPAPHRERGVIPVSLTAGGGVLLRW